MAPGRWRVYGSKQPLSNTPENDKGRIICKRIMVYHDSFHSLHPNTQRSRCSNHKAVNYANAGRCNLESTGLGGCACARHGAIVPHSIVDFQKGER